MGLNFWNWRTHKTDGGEILHDEQFSLMGFGGTGCKIVAEIGANQINMSRSNIFKPIGYDLDYRYFDDLKKEYGEYGYDLRRLKESIDRPPGAPAERNFLIGEIDMKNSSDIEVIEEMIKPTGFEHFTFIVFSAGGGTGNGFFRAISKKMESRYIERVIPIIVFPHIDTDAEEEILNSFATYGLTTKEIDKFRTIILVDNSNFSEYNYKYLMNKCIARCIGTIADAVGLMRIEVMGINIGGALNTLKTTGKITTFGFGSAFYVPDGTKSTCKAIEGAYNHMLCEIGGISSKNGVIFAIIPYRASTSGVEKAIRHFSIKRKIDVGDRIFIAHANTYTVDIVLLISSEVYPKILNLKNILNYKPWLDTQNSQLIQLGLPESEVHELYESADENFKKSFDKK